MPDGHEVWLAWQGAASPDNDVEIAAVTADAGRYLGYVRAVARRREDVTPDEPIGSLHFPYTPAPLLR